MAEITADSPEAVAFELFRIMPGAIADTREQFLEGFAACLLVVQHPDRFSKAPKNE